MRGAMVGALLAACAADEGSPVPSTAGAGGAGGEAGGCCLAAVPALWEGPALLYRGSEAPPECPAPWSIAGPSGGTILVAEGTCACACSAPSGGVCQTPVDILLYDDDACAHPIGLYPAIEVCQGDDGMPYAASARAAPVEVLGGSCTPMPTDDLVPAMWSEQARVCDLSLDAQTCDDGLCQLPPGFGDRPCIHRSGVHACPDEGFTEQTVVYLELEDTRGCTDCNCKAATGLSCPSQSELWANQDCSGAMALVTHDDVCTATGLGFNLGGYHLLVGSPTGGSCEAYGGALIGMAAPSDPHTVCCEPG